ncbi:MAG: acetylglutamate kinase [bacterium]
MEQLIERAGVLVEALPYIKTFRGCTVVIKYGGHAMIDEQLKSMVIQDIVLMKFVGINPVVVHGGGPEITALMDKVGLEAKFVEGQRVTDTETLGIAEMVLAGKLNGEIVNRINQTGGRAVGLTGKDAGLILARKLLSPSTEGKPPRDLGFVGEVVKINPEIIDVLEKAEFIPVVSPLGVDESGQTYNINADSVAAEMAIALKARKLILLTDVRGILQRPDDDSSILSSIRADEVENLIKDEVITTGMIPKVRAAVRVLEAGSRKVHILDGRIPHAILLELFTDRGIGTQILNPAFL